MKKVFPMLLLCVGFISCRDTKAPLKVSSYISNEFHKGDMDLLSHPPAPPHKFDEARTKKPCFCELNGDTVFVYKFTDEKPILYTKIYENMIELSANDEAHQGFRMKTNQSYINQSSFALGNILLAKIYMTYYKDKNIFGFGESVLHIWDTQILCKIRKAKP